MMLRVLFIKDSLTKFWTAQCLEHDIAASGKSVQDAQAEFTRVLDAEFNIRQERGESGLDELNSAPLYFHQIYEPDMAVNIGVDSMSFLAYVFTGAAEHQTIEAGAA